MKEICIDGRKIGSNHSPFIIAEMSGNHNQSLERALQIVDAAAKSGAHAIKLQTFTADTMTIDNDSEQFKIQDKSSLWYGRNLYSLYHEAHTPWEWHSIIFDHARKLGLIPLSTPFDETSVDFLETLDAPCYKIASFENKDLALIRKVAKTGRPLIISTGMATLSDLEEAVGAAREAGCNDLILLKCTSTYPASPESSNLRTMQSMRDLFDCQVGLSDHTIGLGVAVASVALGASVIEKHFTLSRSDGGVDSQFSCEPEEMAQLVMESKSAWESLGRVQYGIQSAAEAKSKIFRRSLYAVCDIQAGQSLSKENVRAIRPGYGLPPSDLERVISLRAKENIARGTPINWNLLV
jgi:pseudaminic acid synthase